LSSLRKKVFKDSAPNLSSLFAALVELCRSSSEIFSNEVFATPYWATDWHKKSDSNGENVREEVSRVVIRWTVAMSEGVGRRNGINTEEFLSDVRPIKVSFD